MRKRGGREREPCASCSHYLTYYTGSMPPRPSRGPTSLGFTWLPLCASHRLVPSASSFCCPLPLPPPSCRTVFSPSAFSHPTVPLEPLAALATRARAISFLPLPRGFPPVCVPLFLPLLLSVCIGGFSRAPRPHLPRIPLRSHPASAPCSSSSSSSSSAPTEHSHRPCSCTRAHSVSSRLSLDSRSFIPFSPFPRLLFFFFFLLLLVLLFPSSFFPPLLSFRGLFFFFCCFFFFLRSLPHTPSPSLPRAA